MIYVANTVYNVIEETADHSTLFSRRFFLFATLHPRALANQSGIRHRARGTGHWLLKILHFLTDRTCPRKFGRLDPGVHRLWVT